MVKKYVTHVNIIQQNYWGEKQIMYYLFKYLYILKSDVEFYLLYILYMYMDVCMYKYMYNVPL